MTEFASVSQTDLADRRRKLRRQRRLRAFQACWRSLAVGGLAVGLVWVTTLPAWVVRRPEQIAIEGNEHLSPQTVQSLLPIAYPQSLLALQPQTIAEQLEAQAPIADAIVTRHLFPPGLTVRIKERHPVAIAYSTSATANSASSQPAASTAPQVGLLDEEGTWMPLEGYTSLNQPFALPTLKVIGMRTQYRSQWKSLYHAVSTSPVEISEINWQDPANLILITDLGIVHLGSYSPRITEQLRALDQMRQLPSKVDPKEISYIDLKNPASPSLQMTQMPTAPQAEQQESELQPEIQEEAEFSTP